MGSLQTSGKWWTLTEDAWVFLFFLLWIVLTIIGIFARDGVSLMLAGLMGIVFALIVFKDATVPVAYSIYFPFFLSIFGALEVIGGALLMRENL